MKEYDLDFSSKVDHAARLSRRIFNTDITDYQKIGQGFYGVVYRAQLSHCPGTVVFKWHKYQNNGIREDQNLATIRRYSFLKVPEVFAVCTETDDVPGECLIMEYLPGITASELKFPDQASLEVFKDEVVTNLRALHAVHNPEGFGDLDGPFYPQWRTFYRTRLDREYAAIQTLMNEESFPAVIRNLIKDTYAAYERILAHTNRISSLVHSDYNIWNVMADPVTCRVTGIIDPMMTCWGDFELDLFHLYNGPGEQLGLIDRYLREITVDDEFFLRSYFYRFWDDIHHYNAVSGYPRRMTMDALLYYAPRLQRELNRV